MEVRQVLGGRYTLLNELGSGGMAVVWRARDEVLGRPVAVKLLAARFSGDPISRGRIRDEARAAANLLHPHIAQVYDYGEAADGDTPLPYVVMELVNGPTLQQRVADGPLPPRTVFRICGEVAAALAYAHAEGLVHRDIKMANIMVTAGGAKVVDFGIAAAIGPAPEDIMLVGTPAYLAPERLTGDAVVSASDVYALGVLLYRLLAGQSPWSVESTTQMLRAHVYVEPAPLPDLPGVPPSVAETIGRCLRKDPSSRPTAGEVSSALADAAEASPEPDVRQGTALRRDPAVAGASGGVSRPAAGEAPGAAGVARSGGAQPPAAVENGAPRVRLRDRRYLLAGGGLAAVIVAVLAAWFLLSDRDAGGRDASASSTGSARVGGGVSVAPSVSLPAASRKPGQPVIAGSGSVAPAGPVKTSGAPAAGRPEQPGQGADPPTTSPPTSPAVIVEPPENPPGTRLSVSGGAVYATCSTLTATLTAWEPASGFSVADVEAGPAVSTMIVFASDDARFRTTVTCVAGSPTTVVLPL